MGDIQGLRKARGAPAARSGSLRGRKEVRCCEWGDRQWGQAGSGENGVPWGCMGGTGAVWGALGLYGVPWGCPGDSGWGYGGGMWGGGPATVDSCLEEGMGPCLAGSATPGAGLFPPCCCSHRCSGGEKADPASGSGVPCTPQSRQQPWCPFPRAAAPALVSEPSSVSGAFGVAGAMPEVQQLSSARGFGGPRSPRDPPCARRGGSPGRGCSCPRGCPGASPRLPRARGRVGVSRPSSTGFALMLQPEACAAGPAISSSPGFRPPAAAVGREAGEPALSPRRWLCLPRFLARSGRAVGWQGTAAIFRAVLQWRGVPWLGRQSPPRPGIDLPEAPARGEPACSVVCERGCGGAVVGL